jgi:hypothetical protein
MEHTQCSETLASKLQTPGNHPEERIRYFDIPPPYGLRIFFEPNLFTYNTSHSQPHSFEDGTVCSETLASKLQTPGNHPEERIRYVDIPTPDVLRLFFEPNLFTYNTPPSQPQSHFIPTRLWRWNRQSVPKRWHLNYRRRGITHKKAYDILYFLSL